MRTKSLALLLAAVLLLTMFAGCGGVTAATPTPEPTPTPVPKIVRDIKIADLYTADDDLIWPGLKWGMTNEEVAAAMDCDIPVQELGQMYLRVLIDDFYSFRQTYPQTAVTINGSPSVLIPLIGDKGLHQLIVIYGADENSRVIVEKESELQPKCEEIGLNEFRDEWNARLAEIIGAVCGPDEEASSFWRRKNFLYTSDRSANFSPDPMLPGHRFSAAQNIYCIWSIGRFTITGRLKAAA